MRCVSVLRRGTVDPQAADEELQRLRETLETLIADLFAFNTAGFPRFARLVDPRIGRDIPWGSPPSALAGALCDYMTRQVGPWEMVYRITDALFGEYGEHPEVADLHRRVCASSSLSPRAASHALRDQAVRTFVTRHFPDYQKLRRFDQRGTSAKRSEQVGFDADQCADAAAYFVGIHVALENASHTPLPGRLDVYAHILEGALDYRACDGLIQQIVLALQTEDFLTQHGESFARALAHIVHCFNEFLAAGLWPPIAPRAYRGFLDKPPGTKKLTEAVRLQFEELTRFLAALRLLDGHGILESDLIDEIDAGLARGMGRLEPLLCYRRALASVYCGDWETVRHTLEHPPAGWRSTWTGFLWAELGEFKKSEASYVDASRTGDFIDRAIAVRGRLALVAILHPRNVPIIPGLKWEDQLEQARSAYEAIDAARTAARARFDQDLSEARRRIPAAQSLFDRSVLLRLTDDCRRGAASAQRSAELQASGKGLALGNPMALLASAYYGMWLCSVPTLLLRDEATAAFADAVLQASRLDVVLDVVLVTRAGSSWPAAAVRRAIGRLVVQGDLRPWHALLDEHVELLRRCTKELVRQAFFTDKEQPREVTHFHPIAIRVTAIATLFAGQHGLVPDAALEQFARLSADLLRGIGVWTRRFDDLTAACTDLVVAACLRLGRTPADLGLDEETLAHVLLARGALDEHRCRELQPVWTRIEPVYRERLLAHLVRADESSRALAAEPDPESEPEPTAERIERLLSAPDDPKPVPRATHMDLVAKHWSQHGSYGAREPIIKLRGASAENDEEATWEIWRAAVLQGLEEERFVNAAPITRRWLASGVHAVAQLALRFVDESLWIRLFEQTRPWPLGSQFCGEFAGLREAIEREDMDGPLRRRFYRRVVSADTDEWSAIVATFADVLVAGDTVTLEDVETLQVLWDRTPAGHEAAEHLLGSFAVVLERAATWTAATRNPLWRAIEPLLMHMPAQLIRRGPHTCEFVEAARHLGRVVAADPWTEPQRDGWARLVAWLDGHGFAACVDGFRAGCT